MPVTSTDRRTRVSSCPRAIRWSIEPPADEEVVKVARAQAIAVYPADCRMLMWSVRTR